ncbi:MAG: hypothetical protein LBS01_06810 [Prevotellaceae bacterium]|jgi:hypothetical protein|nr:hypothetical protein [Prevotellaceae bacterium]
MTTQKKRLFIISALALFIGGTVFAQVGIGTEYPSGMLHIDGKMDNTPLPDSLQQVDDFVVTADGKVGIGTAAPTETLEVNASMIAIRDGSQGQGKVFVSDDEGVGTWQAVSDNGQTALWTMHNDNITFNGDGYETITGTTTITGDAPMLAAGRFRKSANYPNTTLIVPKGLYMVLVNHEILDTREYGKLQIWEGDSPSSGHADESAQQIFKIFYQEKLTGSSFMHNFEADTPIHVTIRLNPVKHPIYTAYTYWDEPALNNRISHLELRFVKLNFDDTYAY